MSVFHMNCTIPSEVVRYVSSPNARGTLNILWSSVATLLFCTWTVLHPPIPPPRPPKAGKLKWKIFLFLRKLMRMVLVLMAPEFLVGMALEEHLSIRSSYKKMQEWAIKDGVDWSWTHSYFANMGGFVVDFGTQKAPDSQNIDDENEVISRNEELGKESIEEILNDPRFHRKPTQMRQCVRNVQNLTGNEWRPNTDQVLLARELSIIASLPNLSEDVLEGLNKSDAVAQLLTVGQITWLIIDITFRWSENLPSSQLEISVLGFSVCAIIAYILQWRKPKDVHLDFHAAADRDPTDANELRRLGSLGPMISNVIHYDSAVNSDFYHAYVFGAAATGTLFGLIHCIAWNFAFPTEVERRLWRIASVMSVEVPIIPMIGSFLDYLGRTKIISIPDWIKQANRILIAITRYHGMEIILFLLYVLVRLYITVEVLRALFFLPPEAFLTTWTSSWPQVG